MNWTALKSQEQIEALRKESETQPVLIFKHSTQCAISGAVLNRLERNWRQDEMTSIKTYYLDLISYRNISNGVADFFKVEHQSPQVMVIRKGNPIYVKSHYDISFDAIKENIFPKN